MGGPQTLITFGAMLMLTMVVLNLNNNLADTDINLAQNRYRLEALSILNSYAEKALQTYFDEATADSVSEKRLNDFAANGNLGPDANDNGSMDDFDDYHNQTVVDTGQSGLAYKIEFDVSYAELSGNQLIDSNSRTYHKRMRIRVLDNYSDPVIYRTFNGLNVRDTLETTVLLSYWFYN